jgi:hypothetical protein
MQVTREQFSTVLRILTMGLAVVLLLLVLGYQEQIERLCNKFCEAKDYTDYSTGYLKSGCSCYNVAPTPYIPPFILGNGTPAT